MKRFIHCCVIFFSRFSLKNAMQLIVKQLKVMQLVSIIINNFGLSLIDIPLCENIRMKKIINYAITRGQRVQKKNCLKRRASEEKNVKQHEIAKSTSGSCGKSPTYTKLIKRKFIIEIGCCRTRCHYYSSRSTAKSHSFDECIRIVSCQPFAAMYHLPTLEWECDATQKNLVKEKNGWDKNIELFIEWILKGLLQSLRMQMPVLSISSQFSMLNFSLAPVISHRFFPQMNGNEGQQKLIGEKTPSVCN